MKNKVLKSIFITDIFMFFILGALASEYMNLWLVIPCVICGVYMIAFTIINHNTWIFAD